jgi:hypothetical protein
MHSIQPLQTYKCLGPLTVSKASRPIQTKRRAFFLVAYPRESQEMVFDAHARAFEFLGGVPRRGIYDNLG